MSKLKEIWSFHVVVLKYSLFFGIAKISVDSKDSGVGCLLVLEKNREIKK